MTNAKNFVDFAVSSAFSNAAQDYLGRGAVIELLRKAWHDKIINGFDLISYCWKYQISTRYFCHVDVKKILEDKAKETCEHLPRIIRTQFGVDNDSAARAMYGLTRSYVSNDIMIELIFGMHKDILRGEVESAVLS